MVMRNDVIGLIYFAHCSAGFIRVFSLSLRLKFLWFFFLIFGGAHRTRKLNFVINICFFCCCPPVPEAIDVDRLFELFICLPNINID